MQILEQIPKLLQFLENEKVEYKPLVELYQRQSKSKFGVNQIKNMQTQENQGYICFTSGDKTYFVNDFLVNGENIFMNDGGSADVKYYNGKAFYTDHTFTFTTSKMNVKFLYYFLKSQQSFINVEYFQGTGLKNLNKKKFQNFQIPLPPLEIQNTIVEILDNFTELNKALEKELELRKKQYEYYREKLLSFKAINPQIKSFHV